MMAGYSERSRLGSPTECMKSLLLIPTLLLFSCAPQPHPRDVLAQRIADADTVFVVRPAGSFGASVRRIAEREFIKTLPRGIAGAEKLKDPELLACSPGDTLVFFQHGIYLGAVQTCGNVFWLNPPVVRKMEAYNDKSGALEAVYRLLSGEHPSYPMPP